MNRPLHIEIDRTLGTGLPVSIIDPATGDSLGAYPTVIDAYHAKVLMEGGTDGIDDGAGGIRTDLNPGCVGADPTVDGTSGVGEYPNAVL